MKPEKKAYEAKSVAIHFMIMNSGKIVLLFLILSLYHTDYTFAQWKLWGVPQGGLQGQVLGGPCVVDSNHNLYVFYSLSSQFNKWDFLSHRWSKLRIIDSDDYRRVISVAICLPNGTIVAGGMGGMFWTTDGGSHWTREWTFPKGIGVNNLAVTPQGSLLAATESGLFASDLTDTFWNKIKGNLPDDGFFSVYATPDDHYFASSSASYQVYRSLDKGNTWAIQDSDYAWIGATAFTVSSQGILIAGGPMGTYESTDEGEDWERKEGDFFNDELNNDEDINVTGFFNSSDGNIFVTTADPEYGGAIMYGHLFDGTPCWWSTDDGIHGIQWKELTGLCGIHCYAILDLAPGLLAGVTDGGVFMSSDKGNSWTPLDSGISTAYVSDVAYKDSALYAALLERGVARSSEGTAWQTINGGLTDSYYYKFFQKGSQLYVAQGTSKWKGAQTIHQWDGKVWHSLPPLEVDMTMETVCADTSGKLFAGDASLPTTPNGPGQTVGLWVLNTNGVSWAASPFYYQDVVQLLASDSGNTIYSFMDSSQGQGPVRPSLYRSTNDGNVWANSWDPVGFPEEGLITVSVMAANKDTFCVASRNTLFRTRDHGTTWTAQPFGRTFNPIGLAFHDGLPFVYDSTQVMETEGDNAPWQVDSGYTGALTSMTVGDNDTAYLGTAANGIYARPMPVRTSADVRHPIATSDSNMFEIFQTPYRLTVVSDQPAISIHLFNILGSDVLSKDGHGTLQVDLTILAAGTYYAIVEAESKREIRKFIVVH